MITDQRWSIFEALLFIADGPLTFERITEVMEEANLEDLLLDWETFVHQYNERMGGLKIVEIAGGYQLRSREEFDEWVRRYKTRIKKIRLSQAALETLAVIAYRQPIIRSEIEDIRGVDATGVLKNLLEKGLVKVLGRSDVPGKPIMYGTSEAFLEHFGLKDLSSLPTLKEMEEYFLEEKNEGAGGDEEGLEKVEEAGESEAASEDSEKTDSGDAVRQADACEREYEPEVDGESTYDEKGDDA